MGNFWATLLNMGKMQGKKLLENGNNNDHAL